MVYYIIRHKTTGRIMPLARRNRGYSHWNPDNQKEELGLFLKIPRLFTSAKSAQKTINQWFAYPNAITRLFSDGEDYHQEPDGRKKEDLEILPFYTRLGTFRLQK